MADNEIQDAVIRHARSDLAAMPDASQLHPEAEYASALEWAKDWVRRNHERQPSLSSELSAMFREGIKDVRATLMESYFGRPERYGEPGTPLNPTPQVVTAEMGNLYGYSAAEDGPAPAGSGPSYAEMLQQQMSRGAVTPDRGMSR